MSDAALLARTNSIITSLTENFSTAPGLAALATARDQFTTDLAVAKQGSTYQKAVKNDSRAKLIGLLHKMGDYIVYTSNGDRTIALSSGFSIAPTGLELTDGASAGSMDLKFAKVPGSRSYVYQIALEPVTSDADWKNFAGTRRKYSFTGLVSGQRYFVRVLAIGSGNQAVYSAVVSRVAQ